MPRVTFVKSARKANPRYNIAVGDSYYHWAFMVGGRGGPKICSKTKPRRSQLTNSTFLGTLYDIEDGALSDAQGEDDFKAVAESLRELGGEQQEKFDNMPDGLQQGDTGQLLENRASQCEEWADAIDEAADELDSKLEALEKAHLEWSEYRTALAEYEELEAEDQEAAEEPVEPDSEDPGEGDLDELKQELIEEVRSACEDANPGID